MISKLLLLSIPAFAASLTTAHNDNSRQASNAAETVLSPANVARIHKLGIYAVDGAVRAQPLVANGVVIVATMANSVYAFNAATSAPLWHAGPLAAPRTSWPGFGAPNEVITYSAGPLGILSTPVIDVAGSAVFVVCHTSTPAVILYKLSLSTGAMLASVTVSASGFDAAYELQRPALTLANGNVYLAFGGFNDQGPWHGWVIGYSAADLSPVGHFNVTPSGAGGGIWQSGGGLAVDGSGNLYAATGNGDYDGTVNFGSSIIKLSPALSLLDWWTPANFADLNAEDLDISSGRPMVIGSLVVVGGKDYRVSSVQQACMGHLQGGGSSCAAAQVFPTGTGSGDHGIYGAVFAGGLGYWPNDGHLYEFSLTGITWSATPVISPGSYSFPGAGCSASSNGASNAILWCTTVAANSEVTPRAGTLRALDPVSLAELWNSDRTGLDSLGTLAKFVSPTVVNGHVYVATLDGGVVVYGLKQPDPELNGNATMRGQAAAR